MKRKDPIQEMRAAQDAANQYARDVFRSVDFNLVGLDQEHFDAAARTIMAQLVLAFGAGWSHARKVRT